MQSPHQAPYPSRLERYTSLPPEVLRQRIDALRTLWVMSERTRPADLPAIQAAIRRHEAKLAGQPLPDERTPREDAA